MIVDSCGKFLRFFKVSGSSPYKFSPLPCFLPALLTLPGMISLLFTKSLPVSTGLNHRNSTSPVICHEPGVMGVSSLNSLTSLSFIRFLVLRLLKSVISDIRSFFEGRLCLLILGCP